MLKIGMLLDLQSDFILPGGVMPIRHPNSVEDTISTLKRIANWMHTNLDVVIYTTSWYAYTDLEINTISPDYKTTFPPHCMGNSNSPEGAFIPGPLRPVDELTVALGIVSPVKNLVRAVFHKSPLVIRKNRVSVWDGCPIFQEILWALNKHQNGEAAEDFDNPCIQFFVAGAPAEMTVDKFVVRAREYSHETVLIDKGIFFLDQEVVPKYENKWKTLGAGSIIIED